MHDAVSAQKWSSLETFERLTSPAIKTWQSPRMACSRSMAAKNERPTGVSGEESASALSGVSVKCEREKVTIN